MFGKFSGHVRTAHDVIPVEVEKDQAMFQDTVERVDNVVAKMRCHAAPTSVLQTSQRLRNSGHTDNLNSFPFFSHPCLSAA